MRLARPLLLLAALALSAAPAFAGPGVAVRWNNCNADAGLLNRNFICNTNSGTEKIVGSFVPSANVTDATGLDVVIELGVGNTTLPQWWFFKNAGSCRQSSLTMTNTGTGISCPDWSSNPPTGGIGSYVVGTHGPNSATLSLSVAVPAAQAQSLATGNEYFAFNLFIDHVSTVGAGSCAGCSMAACIGCKSIKITTPGGAHDQLLNGPANGFDSDIISWQGGGGVVVNGVAGCEGVVPTLKSTWGAVKALYR